MMNSTDSKTKESIVDSRINKILSMRTDSTVLIEAFDSISSFYTDNTIDARRSLRHDIEYQNIALAKKFYQEYDSIYEHLENIAESSEKLKMNCRLMTSKVSAASENMKAFMKKAADLESQRNVYLMQSKEINDFLKIYQLSDEEVKILYSASLDNIDDTKQFFRSMKRLLSAYQDCKLMVENHNYSAGFELLDALGQHQETAYRRLFEWVKMKCETIVENPSLLHEDDIPLQIAVRYLRMKSIYFSQCQDLIINARRNQLVQKFLMALTQGDVQGQVMRAIDLHCHDPIRYIGDMLAWMHQTVVSEEEFLMAIFQDNNVTTNTNTTIEMNTNSLINNTKSLSIDSLNININNQPSSPTISTSQKVDTPRLQGLSVHEMLVRCLQGLGRPLRVRITQTLESRNDISSPTDNIIILYQLTDLLSFYEATFIKLLPIENAIHSTIKGSMLECKRMFIMNLNKQAEVLVQSVPYTILNLLPTTITKECVIQLKSIFYIYSKAMSSVLSDINDICYIDTVIGSILQPLLQGCRLAGQSLKSRDMAIFMLNNVSVIKTEIKEGISNLSSLLPLEDKQKLHLWIDMLHMEENAWIQVLVNEEIKIIYKSSDIDQIVALIQILPSHIIASDEQGLSVIRISNVLRLFYESLQGVSQLSIDEIQSLEYRETIRQSIAHLLEEAYMKVYQLVKDPKHKYLIHGLDSKIQLYSQEDIRVLLQLTH